MRFFAVLFLTQLLSVITQNLFATPNTSHSHEGRVHSHSLPTSGVIHFHKHMHNGRAHIHPYSKKLGSKHTHSNNPRVKAWENAVKHQHGDRFHSHPLPSSGLKHPHKHQHSWRSHSHPLPESGVNHSHQSNKTAVNHIDSEKQSVNKSLNLDQQIIELLNIPISQDATKSKTIKLQTKPSKNVRYKKRKKTSKRMKNVKKSSAKNSQKKKARRKQKIVKTKKSISKSVKQAPEEKATGDRQFNIALRYENGTGIEKNLPQAFNWYRRASKNGNTKAQYNLAILYENGKGTSRDIQQAIRWYTTAASNGDERAKEKLKSLTQANGAVKE